MFKLSNGEKVFPSEIEERVKAHCKFIKHAFVFGKGKSNPSVLVFPNTDLFQAKKCCGLDESSCKYPGSMPELNHCLMDCVKQINEACKAGFETIERVVIVPKELTIENKELTPSFKVVPRVLESHFKNYIDPVIENRLQDLPVDALLVEAKKNGTR